MYCKNHFLGLKGKINLFIGSFGVETNLLNRIIETICRFMSAHDEIEMHTLSLLLCLRFRSVILPFQIRFKSLPKNESKMGFGRDLQGNCIGLAWGFKIPYKRIFVACFFTKNYRRWPENLILKIYFWKFYWTLALA